MKCEKCKSASAVFHYRCVVNGCADERHLCSQCAAEEGFGGVFSQDTGDFLGGLFGSGRGFGFGLPWAGPAFEPFGFWGVAPALIAPVLAPARFEAATGTAEESESKIPSDAGAEMRARRELLALRHQMQAAVLTQDFEKAAEIRDKIKEIEGAG